MIRFAAVALALAAISCKHDQASSSNKASSAAASSAGSSGAAAGGTIDGLRAISVQVNAEGYTPSKIPGKPNEKLLLVFTRTVDASCVSQLKTPNGDMVDLPLNQPVKVAVTVPATGEVGFACGMDMFHGAVVALP